MFTKHVLPYHCWQVHHEKHLKKLRTITANVNSRPPKLLSYQYYQPEKLCDDFYAEKRQTRLNKLLLYNMIGIKNNPADIDCYNNRVVPFTKMRQMRRRLEEIQDENFKIGCRLLKAKPEVDSHSSAIPSEESLHQRRVREYGRVPKNVLNYFSRLVEPSIQPMLRKWLRPCIFFDLAVRNGHSVGRLVVQLFTEACPELVLEMVRMATYKMVNTFHVIRIFPQLWVESEVAVRNNILESGNFMHSGHVLVHGYKEGVLSFPRVNLDGFPRNIINFSISFKALPMLDEKRIAFGVVTSGMRGLQSMQDYGTRSGKTKKKIVCVELGVLND